LIDKFILLILILSLFTSIQKILSITKIV
jgi:hypothetical protein